MNITEDYVSVETAKLLDKRGFDLLFCNNWHIDYDNSDWMDDVSEEDKENGTIIINQYHYPLITHQMAMKWLREVHKLHITVYSCSQESWAYRITKPHQKLEDGAYAEDFASYEETCDAAIKCCLEKLI